MLHYIIIFIAAVFVNNIVLAQFLGICPFLGVSKKIDTALGMSAAVAFVMVLATICTFLIQRYVLDPMNLGFLQTLTFILVIAALVQMVEIVLKKVSPALFTLLESVVYALSTAVGFGLALVLFAGIREQLQFSKIPKAMEGTPIALITAGILAMAFMGFTGIV